VRLSVFVALRPVEDTDLDALFDQMRDPGSVWMAAFTAREPNDRSAFDAHIARLRSSPGITMRAVTRDGQLVGSIASLVVEGIPRSPTGLTVRPGGAASRAGPWRCSSI
jgi:hypothetical protein